MRSLNVLNRPVLLNVESTQDTGKNFVQNGKKKASDGIKDNGIEKTDEDVTLPETSTTEKNVQKKTKQLKPFTPSETIPADQGVDFPYDI